MSSTKLSKPVRRTLIAVGALGLVIAVAIPSAYAGWGRRHRHKGAESAAEMQEHLEYGARKLMNVADANDDQHQAVQALVEELAPQIFGQTLRARALREEFAKALTAEKVDPAELERIRTEGLTIADSISKRGTSLIVEVSNILTPQQRKEMLELWGRFHKE